MLHRVGALCLLLTTGCAVVDDDALAFWDALSIDCTFIDFGANNVFDSDTDATSGGPMTRLQTASELTLDADVDVRVNHDENVAGAFATLNHDSGFHRSDVPDDAAFIQVTFLDTSEGDRRFDTRFIHYQGCPTLAEIYAVDHEDIRFDVRTDDAQCDGVLSVTGVLTLEHELGSGEHFAAVLRLSGDRLHVTDDTSGWGLYAFQPWFVPAEF